MIRDQALAVSGLLVEKIGGPSVKPYQPPGVWQELFGGRGYEADHGDGLYRRSLYTYWRRTVAPPAMMNFDSPSREVCVVRETRTNTPLQALNLMNDTIFLEASRKLAERMLRDGRGDPLGFGVRLMLGREPRAEERRTLAAAAVRFLAYYPQPHRRSPALPRPGRIAARSCARHRDTRGTHRSRQSAIEYG